MFTLERLPDYNYKANLDDILHVGNASDAAPDSFVAQENFLSELESQNKKLGKENDEDLLDALDQSLFKIYKGNVADWEPLTASLDGPSFDKSHPPSRDTDMGDCCWSKDVSDAAVASTEPSRSKAASSTNAQRSGEPRAKSYLQKNKVSDNKKECNIKDSSNPLPKRTKPALCPIPPELMQPKLPARKPPVQRYKVTSRTVAAARAQKEATCNSSPSPTPCSVAISDHSYPSLSRSAATVVTTKTTDVKHVSLVNSNKLNSKVHTARNEVLLVPDVNSLLDMLEENTIGEDCFSPIEEPVASSSKSSSGSKRRGAIMIEPLRLKKRRQTNCENQKPTADEQAPPKSAEQVPYHPALDHNYCQPAASCTSPSKSSEGDETRSDATQQDAVEEPSNKALSAGKVLKWQDYLQRVRLGVRSAPNSPTTSPKIPRGAARKVNNFMVIEGVAQGANPTKPPAQEQVTKPPSPLLDPLTVVKTQPKNKGPSVKLQEFEDYLAQLEKGQQGADAPASSPEDASTTSSSPAYSTDSPMDIALSDSSSAAERDNPPSTRTADRPTGDVRRSSTACDPRKKTLTKVKHATSLKPIPSTRWNSASKPTTAKRERRTVKSQSASKVSSCRKQGGKAVVLNDVTGKLQEILHSLTHQQQDQLHRKSEATPNQQETLQQLLSAIAILKEKGNPVTSRSSIDGPVTTCRNLDPKASTTTAPNQPQKKFPAVPSPLSLIHEIKQNISKKNDCMKDLHPTKSPICTSSPATIFSTVPHRIMRKSSTDSSSSTAHVSSTSKALHSASKPVQHQAVPVQKPFSVKKQINICYPLPSSLKPIVDNPSPARFIPPVTSAPANSSANRVVEQSLSGGADAWTSNCQIPVIITQKHDEDTSEFGLTPEHDHLVETHSRDSGICDTQNLDCDATHTGLSVFNTSSSASRDVLCSAGGSNPCVDVEVSIVKPTLTEADSICVTQQATASVANEESSSRPATTTSEQSKVESDDLEEGEISDSNADGVKSSSSPDLPESSLEPTEEVEDSHDMSVTPRSSCTTTTTTNHIDEQADATSVALPRDSEAENAAKINLYTEVSSTCEHDVDDDALSLDAGEGPRAYQTDVSEDDVDSVPSTRERKKHKKRKHKHKKRRRKHHHRQHHRRRKTRNEELSDYLSDSSTCSRGRFRRRKRRASEDSNLSSLYSSADDNYDVSVPSTKRRRYNQDSYQSRRRRSCSSFSRSRSRSSSLRSRRYGRSESRRRNDSSMRKNNRESRSPSSGVDRSAQHSRNSNAEWDYISRKRVKESVKDQAIRERRVMYVGRITDSTTKFALRQRFRKFGQIDDVELYFRRHKDNYAFVTFRHTNDTYTAIEKGNEGDHAIKYDLCFGGRRQFCQLEYADLDNEGERNGGNDVAVEDDDFDTLLRKAMKR